jgi:tRNA threonylcarbamoyladenosine biosynthesis protein TsaE
MEYRCTLGDAPAMEALGARLARCCPAGVVTHLEGELAAGKTTLARGYLRALGHAAAVKSPTFTLVETYVLAGRTVHHFDLYRLATPTELEFIGIDDYHSAGTDLLIEWPGRGRGVVPAGDLVVAIAICDAGRAVAIEAGSERGSQVISCLKKS